MRIGVYNRYWNTLGGGEKHVGSIAQYLARYGSVDLIAHEPFSIPRLEKRLRLNLSHCQVVVLSSLLEEAAEDLSQEYDLWVNGSFQSAARARAKRSILFVMFPFLGDIILRKVWRKWPLIQPSWFQRRIWDGYGFWETYDVVLANSCYTRDWIRKWWHVNSGVLTPPADLLAGAPMSQKREMILSVGRFFAGGHNKKHGLLIDTFKQMYDSGEIPSWEYHLCGGSHSGGIHRAYLENILDKATSYPIFIHHDIAREDLETLYSEASIFWHAAGFGEDDRRWPERFEHFGITTVEAMSAGCVPVVINKAGQKETVQHGVSGYLWETTEQLQRYTATLMADKAARERLGRQAQQAATSFSYDAFSENLTTLLRTALPDLDR